MVRVLGQRANLTAGKGLMRRRCERRVRVVKDVEKACVLQVEVETLGRKDAKPRLKCGWYRKYDERDKEKTKRV